MYGRRLPYTFEDRTGRNTDSDFDEIYDRMFFHITRRPGTTTTYVYEMAIGASRYRSTSTITRTPSAILEFHPDESLGTVIYPKHQFSIPMAHYLRKAYLFGTSMTRKFVGSDGREYKWGHRTVNGQEWSCTTDDGHLVAHYDLKPPDIPAMFSSGNMLTIYEPFLPLAVEMLTTFIIMRHIAEHNL